MTTRLPARALTAFATTLILAACGGGESAPADTASSTASTPNSSGAASVSQVEMEQGIGPIRDLELGPVDPALADHGKELFTTKCSACHKLEERYVGPRLGTVLSRRRPEFAMNMMLNATEMVQRHPVTKELLGRFYTPMPVQVTEEADARAILEYLRSAQIDTTTTPPGAGGQ